MPLFFSSLTRSWSSDLLYSDQWGSILQEDQRVWHQENVQEHFCPPAKPHQHHHVQGGRPRLCQVRVLFHILSMERKAKLRKLPWSSFCGSVAETSLPLSALDITSNGRDPSFMLSNPSESLLLSLSIQHYIDSMHFC